MLIVKLTTKEMKKYRTSDDFRERLRIRARSRARTMKERKIRVVDAYGRYVDEFFRGESRRVAAYGLSDRAIASLQRSAEMIR